MPSETVAATLQITHIFEALDIPYVIGGSVASTAYGRIRSTQDVDIVADLRLEYVEPLVAMLGEDFYADTEAIRQAVIQRRSFNLIHLTTMFKVDVFVARERLFDQQQLARRQPHLLEPPDAVAFVASPEDVILAKLEWYRLGGEQSERQWQDIQGILDVRGESLDRDYMQKWATTLKVDDLWEKAWADYTARLHELKEKNA